MSHELQWQSFRNECAHNVLKKRLKIFLPFGTVHKSFSIKRITEALILQTQAYSTFSMYRAIISLGAHMRITLSTMFKCRTRENYLPMHRKEWNMSRLLWIHLCYFLKILSYKNLKMLWCFHIHSMPLNFCHKPIFFVKHQLMFIPILLLVFIHDKASRWKYTYTDSVSFSFFIIPDKPKGFLFRGFIPMEQILFI